MDATHLSHPHLSYSRSLLILSYPCEKSKPHSHAIIPIDMGGQRC